MAFDNGAGESARAREDTEGRAALKWGLILLVSVLVVGVALLIVRVGAPMLQGKKLRFVKYKEAAAAFVADGELAKAIDVYRKALSLKPNDLDVRRSLAQTILRSGDLPEAVAEYHRCLKAKPEDTQIQLTLASLHLLAKNIARSAELVDAVLEKEPDNVVALIMSAQCDYEETDANHPVIEVSMITGILPATFSRYDLETPAETLRANPEYEQKLLEAVKASPDKVQPHKNLADFYRLQKRFDDAESEYKKMVELAANDPDVRLHLADFYRNEDLRRFPDAIRQYSDILDRINSKNLFALRGIAGLSLATGDLESARRYIDRLLWEQSSDTFGRYFRGILALYNKDMARAEADFLLVAKENPTYAPARFLLAYAYLLGHQLREAEKTLEQAAKDLTFGRPRLLLAELALNLAEYDRALESLDKLPEKEKDNPLAHLLRGRVHFSRNDPTQAEAPFTKLAQLDEKRSYPQLLLGEVYKRIGKNDRAVAQYELAIAADARSPLPSYLLGLLYEKMGEPVLSMSNFENALKRDPNFAVAGRSLAEAYVKSGGENADAAALAQTLLQRFPNNHVLLDTLSTVFYERREFDKAIVVLELIPEAERDARPQIVYHYAMALFSKGRTAEARREFEKAARWVRRLPKVQEIQETLDEIVHEKGITG